MTTTLDLLDEPSVEEARPEELDLDALLTESVTLADARKALKTYGKKAKVDPALADIAHAAEAALTWVAEYAVARFVESHCACGSSHRTFDGWFVVSTHKRDPHARRFVRSAEHHDLPAWQYTATQETDFCIECVSEFSLPHATVELLTSIDALGAPAACCRSHFAQISLDLETLEDQAIDEGDADLADYDEGDLT